MTVRFLGEIPPGTAEEVAERARATAARFAPFRLTFAGIGTFPPNGSPRVVYATLVEGGEAVARLAAELDDALAGTGLPREARPFLPHVTLARPRSASEARGWAEIRDRRDPSVLGRVDVREMLLKSSELRQEGARHTVIGRFPLAATGPDPGSSRRGGRAGHIPPSGPSRQDYPPGPG